MVNVDSVQSPGWDAFFNLHEAALDNSRMDDCLVGMENCPDFGILETVHGWYFACSTGLTNMNPTDKKSSALALSEQPQDTEKLLLERLKNSTSSEDYFRWMLFVVGFYRGIHKIDAATALLEGFIKASQDIEQSAHCYLALGQIATDEQRLEDALRHFMLALDFAPKKRKVAYVLHNNIGFCLNMLGRFVEGEKHCRNAIAIDWTRASGYRNLGISLHGQGNISAAAWALAEAVRADATDNRASALLEKLLALHPSLAVQCPWATQALTVDEKADPEIPFM
jgi:tetratricopeptide (TPR) repeat protein